MKNKNILVIVIIIVVAGLLALLLARLLSGEDNWICEHGEWVRHGNPSTSRPVGVCASGEQR